MKLQSKTQAALIRGNGQFSVALVRHLENTTKDLIRVSRRILSTHS